MSRHKKRCQYSHTRRRREANLKAGYNFPKFAEEFKKQEEEKLNRITNEF